MRSTLVISTSLLGVTSGLMLGMAATKPAAAPRGTVKMYESYKAAFQGAQADPSMWYIFPRDPTGMLQNEYRVGFGQEQVLGKYDLMDRNNPMGANQRLRPDQESIAPEQCAIQVAMDGTHATLYALGNTPTGYRSGPNVPWTWLQPGQSVRMEHYWKVTMDYNYPDQAVYKLGDGYQLQQEQMQMQQQGGNPYGAQQQGGFGGQQQGGYGGQQQGYGGQQQQGYGGQQQGGYGGQQQGYGGQQQGGYPQQGGQGYGQY